MKEGGIYNNKIIVTVGNLTIKIEIIMKEIKQTRGAANINQWEISKVFTEIGAKRVKGVTLLKVDRSQSLKTPIGDNFLYRLKIVMEWIPLEVGYNLNPNIEMKYKEVGIKAFSISFLQDPVNIEINLIVVHTRIMKEITTITRMTNIKTIEKIDSIGIR